MPHLEMLKCEKLIKRKNIRKVNGKSRMLHFSLKICGKNLVLDEIWHYW